MMNSDWFYTDLTQPPGRPGKVIREVTVVTGS